MANNKFYKVSDYTTDDYCVKVSPYNAYLLTDSDSAAKYASILNIESNEEETGIDRVIDSLNECAEYYDINGYRFKSPQKGLNIVKRGNKTMKRIIK